MLFPKNSAFHPEVDAVPAPPVESTRTRDARVAREQRYGMVKEGHIQIPVREVEDILSDLTWLGERIELNPTGPGAQDVQEISDRLASYLRG